MKKGQQEIYPIKMNLKEIFSVFKTVAFPEIELIDSRNVIFFKVDSLRAIQQIEKIFLQLVVKYNPTAIGKKLVSNKRKPLFLKASLIPNFLGYDMWKFHVYQEHAKGIVIETHISLNSYADIGAELSVVLVMLTERYYREKEAIEAKRKFAALETKLFLLSLEDLEYFMTMGYITGPEKTQVIYTYDFYKNQYDLYTKYIDDNKQREEKYAKNAEIKPILQLCEKCFVEFEFEPHEYIAICGRI